MGTLFGVITNTTNVKKIFLSEEILTDSTDDIKELLSILLKWQWHCNYVRKYSYFLEIYVRLI